MHRLSLNIHFLSVLADTAEPPVPTPEPTPKPTSLTTQNCPASVDSAFLVRNKVFFFNDEVGRNKIYVKYINQAYMAKTYSIDIIMIIPKTLHIQYAYTYTILYM